MKKSCLYGIGVKEDRRRELAEAIGCDHGKIPFVYLGVMLGATPSKYAT